MKKLYKIISKSYFNSNLFCFATKTIFDKILAQEIPSKKVYEDDLVLTCHLFQDLRF